MYKLETSFANFRFDSICRKGPYSIKWFLLEEGDNSDEFGRSFNNNELQLFQNFVINHPDNFPGNKNYLTSSEGEEPYCSGLLNLKQNIIFPKNIILRRKPFLCPRGEFYNCMDVILMNVGCNDKHDYNLDFNVIGVIQD